MSENWAADKARTDPHIPQVRTLLAPYVVHIASAHADQKEATDLLTKAMRIAVRGRDAKLDLLNTAYPGRKHDVCIRSKRANGVRTEWAKIFEDGYADLLFYYHFDVLFLMGSCIRAWLLLDLHALRAQHAAGRLRPGIHYRGPIANVGGETFLNAIDSRTLDPGVVVKKGAFW